MTNILVAKVVAHEDLLITELLTIDRKDNVVPTGGSRFGTVILDSKRIGISPEAMRLLAAIPSGGDAIGDVDWFKCDNNLYAFAWFGPLHRIFSAKEAIAARGFRTYPEQYTPIDNVVTDEMLAAITAKQSMWKEPYGV